MIVLCLSRGICVCMCVHFDVCTKKDATVLCGSYTGAGVVWLCKTDTRQHILSVYRPTTHRHINKHTLIHIHTLERIDKKHIQTLIHTNSPEHTLYINSHCLPETPRRKYTKKTHNHSNTGVSTHTTGTTESRVFTHKQSKPKTHGLGPTKAQT